MNIIGQRVRIVREDHPHFGETGTAVRMEMTLFKPGLVIKLDDCPHLVEECFVFDPSEIVSLPSLRDKHG